MGLQKLVEIIHNQKLENWTEANAEAFDDLFGSRGRYPQAARATLKVRAPAMKGDDGVSYAAFIHPDSPNSGAYSGMSFVMFPVPDAPCLIGMVVGTGGLRPDEQTLGRPGHARKLNAICAWLSKAGDGTGRAWAKHDPTRTDIGVPDDVRREMPEYRAAFEKYGGVMYALYRPGADRTWTERALMAFLDLLVSERGYPTLKGEEVSAAAIQNSWFETLLPGLTRDAVASLLQRRKYAVIQGPPGTGKTRMARELLQRDYGGFGQSIQFHPNTTYESFIGGLAPVTGTHDVGLQFRPAPGALMRAAALARETPDRPFLLHIDEINRADLGKVLGEALYLLDCDTEGEARTIELAYDFGGPLHRKFSLPANLHILGTMNSADRSIAIVDVAVRRRFAFLSLWPSMAVVNNYGGKLMQKAFKDLTSHFVEHASNDVFSLLPGHSYFLEMDDAAAIEKLQTNLLPLLEEYLSQGYVSGFAEPVRGYMQWLNALRK